MNYFVEGLQGSGKSTLVKKISDIHPNYLAVQEFCSLKKLQNCMKYSLFLIPVMNLFSKAHHVFNLYFCSII